MNPMYYLPEIIVVIVIGVALIWGFFLIRELLRVRRNASTCMYCKADAVKDSGHIYWFLLPISFGDTYDEEEKFLISNMRPIMGKDQIPTGQRACKAEVFHCTRCNKRQVDIEDFLQVRGEEYPKGHYTFAYEHFKHLLESWDGMEEKMYRGSRNA